MPEITIHIFPSSEEDGFMYEIYLGSPEETTDTDSFDGGLCTSTFENAVEMAADQAIMAWKSRQDLPESQR
jgi:hypothetical protein